MAEGKIFVGRKAELEQFKEVLNNSKGQAVLVFGQSRKAFSTRPSAGKHWTFALHRFSIDAYI